MNISKYLSSKFEKHLSRYILPFFYFLTIIGVLYSVQFFLFFFKGKLTLVNFLLVLLTKLIYTWYFLIIPFWAKKIFREKKENPIKSFYWMQKQFYGLILFVVSHQFIGYIFENFVLVQRRAPGFIDLLINNPAVWTDMIVYVLIILGFYFIESIRVHNDNKIKYAELEMKLIKSRLNELRGKIRPAFLFRTLDSISEMISSEQNKEANRLLNVLSDYLRLTIYGAENEEITLKEEMKFLKLYLEIQNIVTGNKIEFFENIENELYDSFVPNFLIHLIVEEIITSTYAENNSVIIKLNVFKLDNRLNIVIHPDKFNRIDDYLKNDSEKIIRQRLSTLYAENYDFTIFEEKASHFVFNLIIPLRLENELANQLLTEDEA